MRESTSDPPFAPHFDGKRFYNPNAPQVHSLRDVLRWKFTSRPEQSPVFISDVRQSKPPRRVEGNELRVTLVNHSTVLLQFDARNILTDPIWSERASPMSWIGPRRHRKPGIAWDDLPPIDVVLLSHNHYDHWDIPTLRRLAGRGHSNFVTPARSRSLLESEKKVRAGELDWGESVTVAGVKIHSVPALHFSGRGLFDRNRALWCGYMIETQQRMIYFAGDTAFGAHFAQIRERFGSPRIALLPIGAYQPRWFMAPVHMAPGEAVRAHEILGAATSIAIHHGTFQLTDEAIDTPKQDLAAHVNDQAFLTLNNGEFVTL